MFGVGVGVGGGDGVVLRAIAFSLACEDLGKMFDHSIPASVFLFCFVVEISSRTLISLFMPRSVQNGSASSDDCG